MKNKLKIILLICLFYYSNKINSQVYISSSITGNYWEHSELFGIGIGTGLSYKINKYTFSLNYEFGYGTRDRFKSLNNINYENYSTVLLDNDKGSWKKYLGIVEDYPNYIKGVSDYAKQHQLSLMGSYNINIKSDFELTLGTGFYGAIIDHFFTFKNIPIYYVDLVPFYEGPLNYIPVATQKILTYGINFEVSLNIKKSNKIWSPFFEFGIGPNYSSYISSGLRLKVKAISKQ